ncbi:uncharacterized protein LOC119388942 [Rhipicephalus sanguineus]|uniref:uncharacterized protein LOC119388942 n=1 Tax=Rhipicephalus sanguineus TaxID=34632 RepID=UPI0020C3E21C|nr:uncharacterized protein LOC119388942 [Rhipicephalus sanguineus]
MDVHFAGWRQRFEGKIVLIFSIVVALLIGVAVCFVFGTSSEAKASSGSHEPLTDFTVPTALTSARRQTQESQLEAEGTATASGGPKNASVKWSNDSSSQVSTGTSTLDPSTGVNCSTATPE